MLDPPWDQDATLQRARGVVKILDESIQPYGLDQGHDTYRYRTQHGPSEILARFGNTAERGGRWAIGVIKIGSWTRMSFA
jgi:hypothetical protein